MDGPLSHIGTGPDSLWTCYVGSLEGPAGRTPRPPSPRRLYRALSAATHICSVSPDRAQDGTFSRRRRTYFQVYPLHYSPRFLKCPRPYAAPTLFGATDRVRSHIESRPESLWSWPMGRMEGREGRTPRRRSPRRLYRAASERTDACSWRSDWSHYRVTFRAEGALTSGCIPSHYSPRFLKRTRCTTEPTLFGAVDRVVTDIGIA